MEANQKSSPEQIKNEYTDTTYYKKTPINLNDGISWNKFGPVDEFIQDRKEEYFKSYYPIKIELNDSPGDMDTEESGSKKKKKKKKNFLLKKRNLFRRKIKNTKKRTMGKKRNFKQNCQARM